MGGGDWVDILYARRERARREIAFNQRQSQPAPMGEVPIYQPVYKNLRPTRFDRILDTDEVPSVSSKPSTPLFGSTRFDRILRDDED